ncbi:MAG: lysostaphin resistance A-like protein, partial [Oscillospiraceae bacterium]
MSEIVENSPEKQPSLKAGYKRLCIRLGLMIIVIFASRGISTILLALIQPSLQNLGATGAYVVETAFSLVFLYFIPMIATALLLKTPIGEMSKKIYTKPKYFGSALGMFPAFYSLAIIVNLLTMWITSLFKNTNFNDSFNTVNELSSPNFFCGIILFVQMVVIAPLFEEFWFRGMVLESLRPYGNGVAIFISALLFGLTHANFAQFFYAALMGIFLGYIAVSTK